MKVSFKPCVHRHRQRKDKTFSVIIRIGYKSKYAFIETQYSVSKTDLTKKLEISNREILNKCNAIITQYTDIIKSIDENNIIDVQDIVTYINKGINTNDEIDFMSFFRSHLEKLKSKESKSVQIYSATYNHLIAFVKSDSLSIKRVTPKFLSEFESYLNEKEIGSRGQNLYMSNIRSVFNACIDEYEEFGYTISYPFRKYKLPKVKPPKTVALTKEQLLEIINIDLGNKIRANRARYAFVVSLLTLGTNAADLYDLDSIKDNRIEYNRNKTKSRRTDNAFISIKVEPELLPYLEILKGKNNSIFCFSEWYKNKQQFNKGINKGLEQVVQVINEKHRNILKAKLENENASQKEIEKVLENGFIHYFDFYDARRTMASVMRNKLGISKDDVALCLNHKDMAHKTTDQYIEVDFSILDKCNRQFIDWLYDKTDVKNI